MNSGYDETQQDMHPTKIKQVVGCFGPNKQIIEVGGDPHMVSQEGGNVPFWITPQGRVVTKFSQCDEL